MVCNLLFFGWALGVFTSGLLIRFGHSVEALIWGIPFLIQPFSAIYYPLSTLPKWCQVISQFLPSTYVFEGMRAVVNGDQVNGIIFLKAFGLNGMYFILAGLFFNWMYRQSRKIGRLGRLGLD
jgi:ABC-2 type transport system permease protein